MENVTWQVWPMTHQRCTVLQCKFGWFQPKCTRTFYCQINFLLAPPPMVVKHSTVFLTVWYLDDSAFLHIRHAQKALGFVQMKRDNSAYQLVAYFTVVGEYSYVRTSPVNVQYVEWLSGAAHLLLVVACCFGVTCYTYVPKY